MFRPPLSAVGHCQATKIIPLNEIEAARPLHDNKFLLILVCDLEDAVFIRIIDQLNKAGALGRLEAYKDTGCISINICKFNSKEPSCTPITFQRSRCDFM